MAEGTTAESEQPEASLLSVVVDSKCVLGKLPPSLPVYMLIYEL